MTQIKLEELLKKLIKEAIKEALTDADIQLCSNDWSRDEIIKEVTIENIKFSGEDEY